MKLQLSKIGSVIALLLVLSFFAGATIISKRQKSLHSPAVQMSSLPTQFGEWQGTPTQGMDIRAQEILKLDSYVIRTYTKGEHTVDLYIGYWKHQTGDHQAAKHSPTVCLPANGWATTALGKHQVQLQNANSNTQEVRSIYAKSKHGKLLFNYWFFSGQDTYTDDWKALIYISLENLIHRRSDGGIVEVRTSLVDKNGNSLQTADAQKTLDEFLQDFVPELTKLTATK